MKCSILLLLLLLALGMISCKEWQIQYPEDTERTKLTPSPLLVLSPTSESSGYNAVGDNTNSGKKKQCSIEIICKKLLDLVVFMHSSCYA